MTPCNDVIGYQCFRGPCCFHVQGEETGSWKGHRTGSIRGGGSRVTSGPKGSRGKTVLFLGPLLGVQSPIQDNKKQGKKYAVNGH